ncbi:MAG: ABC transporter permease subunit [Chloroflexota bacterium]
MTSSQPPPSGPASPQRIPLWRDERFLRILGQAIFLLLLAAFLGYLGNNMLANLRQQGLALGFDFLRTTSGFDIGEHAIPYDRSSTYLRAFTVGLINTALVSFLGIVFATLLGIIFGVGQLSGNLLVRWLARAYIEILRNIPLLVLLIFLYSAVFIKFPRVKEALILPGPTYLTNRGVAIPWGLPTDTFNVYRIILGLGLLAATGVGLALNWYGKRTGRAPLSAVWGSLAFCAVAVLGWFALPGAPLSPSLPEVQGLRLAGGLQLSPEFMTLLTGLVIYTSAFIADVVRAGIQAVSLGQVEAAKSVGLTSFQTLRLVVFPQALRVIIPPLTSQYLNLAKNSSLAVAIGYPELFHVSGTVLNQSGRAVEVIVIVMSVYLSISLLTSLLMNLYNRRIRLVER